MLVFFFLRYVGTMLRMTMGIRVVAVVLKPLFLMPALVVVEEKGGGRQRG